MIMRDDIISMPKDELHPFLQELRKDMKKGTDADFKEAAKSGIKFDI